MVRAMLLGVDSEWTVAVRKQRSDSNIFGDGAAVASLDGSDGPVRQRTRWEGGSLTLFHTVEELD